MFVAPNKSFLYFISCSIISGCFLLNFRHPICWANPVVRRSTSWRTSSAGSRRRARRKSNLQVLNILFNWFVKIKTFFFIQFGYQHNNSCFVQRSWSLLRKFRNLQNLIGCLGWLYNPHLEKFSFFEPHFNVLWYQKIIRNTETFQFVKWIFLEN